MGTGKVVAPVATLPDKFKSHGQLLVEIMYYLLTQTVCDRHKMSVT